jgi:hypothetical protein
LPTGREFDPMTDYWNRFSQAEKKQEIVRDTFMNRAAADAELLNSGRFAKEQATTVVGATPSAPVPQQPPNSPWGGDNPIPAGGELDYFGQDINVIVVLLF